MEQNLISAILAAVEQHFKAVIDVKISEALAAQPKQEATPQTIDVPAFIDTIDKQEWFWAKMQTFVEKELDSKIEAAVENAIDAHCSDYDHEEYDSIVRRLNDYDLDYFVTTDDLESKIDEALDNRNLITDDDVESKVNDAIEAIVDEKVDEAMTAHHNAYNHDLFVTDASLREFIRTDVKISIDV